MSQVVVLAEQKEGTLVKGTLSAIGAAQQIAASIGGGYDIVVAGANVGAVAEELAQYGASRVLTLSDGALAGYTAQAYARALDALVRHSGAKYVVATATSIGKDVTPGVAARLKLGSRAMWSLSKTMVVAWCTRGPCGQAMYSAK